MICKTVKCVALCASALFLVSCGDSGPGAVALEMSDLMHDGKAKEAVVYINATDKKKTDLEEMFTVKVIPMIESESKKHGGVEKVFVESEIIAPDGKSAEVKLRTLYGDGKAESSSYNLELVDGKWLVQDPFKNK